jgi:hypothetical protein
VLGLKVGLSLGITSYGDLPDLSCERFSLRCRSGVRGCDTRDVPMPDACLIKAIKADSAAKCTRGCVSTRIAAHATRSSIHIGTSSQTMDRAQVTQDTTPLLEKRWGPTQLSLHIALRRSSTEFATDGVESLRQEVAMESAESHAAGRKQRPWERALSQPIFPICRSTRQEWGYARGGGRVATTEAIGATTETIGCET